MVNKWDERRIDNMVNSIKGQIDMNGPIMQYVNSVAPDQPVDGRTWMPLLFSMGSVIEELWDQIGRLDARVQAIDGVDEDNQG